MMRFIFWNLNRYEQIELLAKCLAHEACDILALAECEFDPAELAKQIAILTGNTFRVVPRVSEVTRLVLLSSLPADDFRETYVNANGRLSLSRIRTAELSLGFAVVHLKSPVGMWTDVELNSEAKLVAQEIRERAAQERIEHLCIVGDFNLQPFDEAISSAHGFFGLSTKFGVALGSRTIQGREFNPFYNPMWNCFGDTTAGPPGTFYRKDASPLCYDWHMLDQVLISVGLLPYLSSPVEIVTSFGEEPLIDEHGRPTGLMSDHLPIRFDLALMKLKARKREVRI